MRTVVVGNRALAKHVLASLLREGWNVVGAVSAAGEATREQAGYIPFDDLARRHDLSLIETTDINDDATRQRLADLEPDLCICPGWHQIIDERILEIPTEGFVGFHASDLPRGRGGAPVNWTIIHGASEITLSLFYYMPGVDAGDVIHKETIPIEAR
ncbi:MAG: methionyl-tRNA formyltransferase, partial [Haloplanus sp.]